MSGISEVVSGLEMEEGRVVGARSFLLTWLLQHQYTQQAEVRSQRRKPGGLSAGNIRMHSNIYLLFSIDLQSNNGLNDNLL